VKKSLIEEQKNKTSAKNIFIHFFFVRIKTIHMNVNNARIECERNLCENELQRLRYGLDRLLTSMNSNGFDRSRKSHRSRNHGRGYTEQIGREMIVHKSLLYQILEAKLFDCLRTNQMSLSNSLIKYEKTPSDSLSILFSSPPHLITPQVSNIDPVENRLTHKHSKISFNILDKSKNFI
jgi:hypothetical protein